MFSKGTQYAIRAVLFLAIHSSEQNKIGGKELGEALQVPFHFLAKVLQQLSRHDCITSAKGPHGGFFLNEANLEVSLLDVIESMEGVDFFSKCVLGFPACDNDHPCPLHVQVSGFRQSLIYQWKHQTIGELASRMQKAGIAI